MSVPRSRRSEGGSLSYISRMREKTPPVSSRLVDGGGPFGALLAQRHRKIHPLGCGHDRAGSRRRELLILRISSLSVSPRRIHAKDIRPADEPVRACSIILRVGHPGGVDEGDLAGLDGLQAQP